MNIFRTTISLGITASLLLFPFLLYAQSVDELRNTIAEKQSSIQEIEEEIKEFEEELVEIGKEKHTLQSAVRELDVSRQKVQSNITLAQRKINNASASISELEADITEKESRMAKNQDALGEALRRVHEAESDSFVEVLLRSKNISNLWTGVETLQQFQIVVRNEVSTLAEQRTELLSVKEEKQREQGILVEQKEELSTQRISLDINRREKEGLLNRTKSEESEYQALLEEKRKAKEEFEAQLNAFEQELKFKLDPSSIPPAGKGVLTWPVGVNARVTQYFGNTKFAQSGAYSGSGHNGMDFGIPTGTPVKAALAGNVKATGNTDAFPGCYSYGKWILLEHVNGLATLYAHLSSINVNPGEAVSTAQVIGYSGNTGYSTGPHLHFTVYAGDAVEVVRLGDVKSRTNCADAKIPVSAWEGYLNPIDYL